MNNKRPLIILATVGILLLIPFVAMQFSNEVDWKTNDFIAMGTLLLATGSMCELVLRKVKSTKNRVIMCGSILFVCLLIWAELAVGIFGSPFAGS